ncbi:hypothetical protein [Pseudooctadecabacter sp.]|uniref:hypothetical protein n=1 Tax=Pseudooctadecabacter sp. TaxID=1966338 RepID=UPI0035C78D8C
MILSRTLAKSRMARGARPGWAAAWAPVMFDAACLVFVFMLAYRPFQSLVETFDMPTWAVVTALLALGFIPVQAVLIFSSLWAAKSRFQDEDGNQ